MRRSALRPRIWKQECLESLIPWTRNVISIEVFRIAQYQLRINYWNTLELINCAIYRRPHHSKQQRHQRMNKAENMEPDGGHQLVCARHEINNKIHFKLLVFLRENINNVDLPCDKTAINLCFKVFVGSQHGSNFSPPFRWS